MFGHGNDVCFCLQGVSSQKSQLEEQLVLWDQVESSQEELSAWLTPTLTNLQDSATHFSDTTIIHSQLAKYKVNNHHISHNYLGIR